MLFTQSGLKPGDSVLVQGVGGGVSSALICLARAAGMRVFATSRDASKRTRALDIGAHETLQTGDRLPHRVDAVMDTVGAATWSHSVKASPARRHARSERGPPLGRTRSPPS